MRMTQKSVLSLGTVLAVAALAACSESPVAPQSRAALVPKSSFAVGDLTSSTPVQGILKVCKSSGSDASGTFNASINSSGTGGTGSPTIETDLVVAPGECRVLAIDNGNGNQLMGDFFSVTESAPAVPGTIQTLDSCVEFTGGSLACNDNYFVNNVHGWVLTFTNTLPPPPPTGCTYTKGWYRNNGASTITGVDGLTTTVEGAIFAATPGKPGPVSWTGGGNNVLNLYQQLLAALENGGDASGITEVEQAISDAQGLTSVSGYQITYTGTQEQLSSLINTLSAFNEGSYEGWPHCS